MSMTVTIDNTVIGISIAGTGPQGATGPTGATGATGATGPQGPQGVPGVVQTVTGTAPITVGGTAADPVVGINQAGITIAQSQVTSLTTDLAAKAAKASANTFTANQIIEVTDNTNAALRVTQLGTGAALRIEDSANPDSTPFVVDASGNVGIGTASPASPLHVEGGDANIRTTANNAFSQSLLMQKSRAGAVVQSGDAAGQLLFQAFDGSAFQSLAQIRGAVDATPGAGDMPGRLVFSTTPDGSATLTERMRIDNTGLITGTGPSLGAWTAYTPTLGGTGWALGDGTAAGYYCQIGKTCIFTVEIVFGSTSTYGTVPPTATLPIAAKTTSASANPMGRWIGANYRDTSASTEYRGGSAISGSTAVIAYVIGTNGQRTNVTATAPFTWASGDSLWFSGIYEAA